MTFNLSSPLIPLQRGKNEDYALTEYDWRKVKSKSFQDALTNYKEKKKELESAIKKLPSIKKQYVGKGFFLSGFII